MKILNYLLSLGILLGLLVAAGCSDDDAPPEPDPLEERITLLASSTWNFSTVNQGTVDISSDFTGATLTLNSSQNFQTANINPVYDAIWPASGTWSLPTINELLFNGITMTIVTSTENQLTVTFNFTTASANQGGRSASLDGDYTVTYTR